MLSDEEREALEILELYFGENSALYITKYVNIVLNLIKKQSKEIEEYKKQLDLDNECEIALNSKVMDLEKEIEELKASHITTNNKATNTEKAKIFDVIDNSIDTYIEKSKPYWEQIMTKDEMTIDEALTIIDDMYQDRYKIMSQKTEKETIVDLGKMDYIKFTNLEWASVRALREVQSLNYKLEKLQDKIKAKIEELEKLDFGTDLVSQFTANLTTITILQSLLEKE